MDASIELFEYRIEQTAAYIWRPGDDLDVPWPLWSTKAATRRIRITHVVVTLTRLDDTAWVRARMNYVGRHINRGGVLGAEVTGDIWTWSKDALEPFPGLASAVEETLNKLNAGPAVGLPT